MKDTFIKKTFILFLLVVLTVLSPVVCTGEIIVVRNDDSVLPLNLEKQRIKIVSIGKSDDNLFTDYCRRYCSIETESVKSILASSSGDDSNSHVEVVIAAVFSSDKDAVAKFKALNTVHDVVAVFFLPKKEVALFSDCGPMHTLVIADDECDDVMIECAEAVFGGNLIDEMLLTDIPGVGRIGDGCVIEKSRLGYAKPDEVGFSPDIVSKIDSIVELNIRKQSFPGCQIVVVKGGNVVIDKAYGTLDYGAKSKKVDRYTLYDIASMTKATATIAGLMKAYDKRLYELDNPASKYLPRLKNTDKSRLTVRDFMYHTTGIPATVNTYSLMVDSSSFSGKLIQYKNAAPYTVKLDKGVYGHQGARLRPDLFHKVKSEGFDIEIAKGIFGGKDMVERMRNAIYNRTVGQKKYLYSCLNFCILSDMEESLTGIPHEQWVNDNIFAPIGANHTMFRPSDKHIDMENIAPTEYDRFMRKQHLRGYVHDEMASYLGGVAGNAGLFSTAGDIAKLCQMWLNEGLYGDVQILSPATVRLFTTDKNRTINRGLGFDFADRIKSMDDIGMPESTFGHTGFTGTCFWIDPDNEIIVVILTNRVNPSRDNRSFNSLNPRKAILKTVYDSLDY